MSLNRLFMVTTIVLFTLVELMFSRILLSEWRVYQSSTDGLSAIGVAHKALVVAEKASFERGPTNGVLGDKDKRDPKKLARLRKFRAVTDAAIHSLATALADSPTLPHRAEATASLQKAEELLAIARREVDRVAAIPKKRRTAENVMGAVHDMYDVIPAAMQCATALSRGAEEIYPQFSDALVAARLAADLREYAGRLGSQFTAALSAQKPMADRDRLGYYSIRGRIDELLQLIQLRTRTAGTDPRIVAAEKTMEQRYFGHDLAFAASIERASTEHRPYGIDTAQFAAAYVPDMASIVNLRDVLVATVIEAAQASHNEARQNLIWISIMGAITFIIVVMLFMVIRWRVVGPLLRTTRVIVDIANGELLTEVPQGDRHDEIGDMLKAVATLKANSVEKQRLEGERQHLIDELKSMSSTDYLTGLLNRRAFAEGAVAALANAKRYGWPLALIMFDIDHFKSINDRFGHDGGDVVLVEIAAIAKREFREGDILARHGGEEFVALAANCDFERAKALADRVRAAIEASTVSLNDGRILKFTASFGGVVTSGASRDSLEGLFHTADLALYAAKGEGRNRVVIHDDDATVTIEA